MDLLAQRWRGEPGRLEAWYTTITDPATGTGVWLHHEIVAPSDGEPAYGHGWATVFPPGAAPMFARYDAPAARPGDLLAGQAGEIGWRLTASHGGAPVYTFPRWAWRHGVLPAAHVVPAPDARYTGTVRYPGGALDLRGALGATAHIYGHGNAGRWAWLHADLGDGDLVEIVAAVASRPGLRLLPPLSLLVVRLGGVDWPAGDPLWNARAFRARIGLPTWTVTGRVRDCALRVDVTQHPDETVTVPYTNPDGTEVVCRNSERADAVVSLARRAGTGWRLERRWRLAGTAHAEVGGPA